MKYDDDKRSDQVHDSGRVGQHEEAAVGTIDWDGQKAGKSERLISFKIIHFVSVKCTVIL